MSNSRSKSHMSLLCTSRPAVFSRRLLPLTALGLGWWLTGTASTALADDTAATTTASPASAATSAKSKLTPSYDVLLPDPEPTGESQSRGDKGDDSSDIDIADRVLSAAKQVTTVQEAPSIVTVIRADEIASRGYRNITQVLETIPGWMTTSGIGNHLNLPLVRGTGQAALLLRDGVSMFEPMLNAGAYNRSIPLESIKSIEVVTGPGGVLWGANSFLGIINLISKDADDINGVEAGIGYGDGSGSPQNFRAWALFGKTFKFKRGPSLGIVQHVSYENYLSPEYTALSTISRSAAPSPPGPQIYSDLGQTNPARAYILDISGKLTYGPVTLSYAIPIGEMNNSLSFGNNLARGVYDTATMMPSTQPQVNHINMMDRYITIQYKSRFLGDRLGLDAKLYGVQFERHLDAVILPGTKLNPGGLTFKAPIESYRVGFSVDGDAGLPLNNRLLWGGDVFHEWVPEATVRFPGVPDPSKLPIACPLQSVTQPITSASFVPECPIPFNTAASRTVAALYISDQFRPVRSLTLDGGVRYQVGLGQRGYQGALIGGNGQLLGSASLVWNFYREMHFKANYANGFRSPVFNNTDSNGAGVQFGGNTSLKNEESQAFQGEWNARLLKNIGPIRALQLRADYAYTELKSLIVVNNGSYSNRRSDDRTSTDPSKRRIHSVEASARLFAGDHTLSLGYTFLHISTNDRGVLRNIPQHTFSLGWVLSVIPGWLEQNGTLLVLGGYDDPNRLRTISLADGVTTVANFSDLTFDKLPPQAILNLGARAKFLKNRLWTSINFFNVLNQRAYFPDPFYDLAPTLEVNPTPAPGWSFFLQVGGKPW